MARTSSTEASTEASPGRDAVIERLVAAAARLFAVRGPDGVSLRQVAAEAGVNYGLIHQYIGTKDALLRLVFRSVSEGAAQRVTASDDLDGALDQLIGTGTTRSRYVAMLAWAILQGRDAHALLGRSPALQAVLERMPEPAAESPDARLRVAMVVAMNLGWQLFGEFVASGIGLDDLDDRTLATARRDLSRELLGGPRIGGSPPQ